MGATPTNLGEIQSTFAADLTANQGELQTQEGTEGQTPEPSSPDSTLPDSGTEGVSPTPPGEEPSESQQAADQQTQSATDSDEIDADDWDLDDTDESTTQQATDQQTDQQQTEQQTQEPTTPKPRLTDEQGQQLEQLLEADPENVLGRVLQTSRGKRMHGAFKILRDLSRPEKLEDGTDGGIGFEPTADQLKQHYRSHVINQRLQADLSSGDPQRIGDWIKIHFGRSQEMDQNGQPKQFQGTIEAMEALPETLMRENPHALNILANKIPDVLAANPQIFQTYAQPFMLLAEDQLRKQLGSVTAEEDKRRLLDAANLVHYTVTGQWPAEPNGQPAAGATPGQTSPELEQLRQQNANLQNQFRQMQTQQTQQTLQQNDTQIRNALANALSDDVHKALAVLEDGVLKTSFHGQLSKEMESLMQQNPTQHALLQDQIRQAAQAGNLGAIPALVQAQRQLYREALKSSRPKYLEAAGKRVRKQNRDTHAQLQRSAQRTESNASGRPVNQQQIQSQSLERQEGETQQAYIQRVFATDIRRSI